MGALSHKVQKVTIALTHITTLAGLIAMLVWCAKYLKFSVKAGHEFAWHPFLMYFGFMFCFGHAALAFRTLPFSRKANKYVHFGLQTLGIISVSLGLTAVFRNHIERGLGHLHSLHSWLGIGVFGLFCLQYLGSIYALVLPVVSAERQADIIPWHVAVGCWLYIAAGAVCLLGIQEYSGFYSPADSCSGGSTVCKLSNSIGVIILAATVFMLLSLNNFNRPMPYAADESYDSMSDSGEEEKEHNELVVQEQ